MYSTCTWEFGSQTCGSYSQVCDCYNREHSIPQSWFNSQAPMVSDAFHIYPTDGKVNGQRSNFPFGECANGTSLGGKALGKLGSCTFPGYSGTVFEPVDEYKGDFARTYFYFATRYESKMPSISGDSFNKTTYPTLADWAINLFLKWSRQDPVSQKEIDRNNAIYQIQKNRNPFIDHPELAEYIWGDKKGIAWSQNAVTGPQVLTPANNSTVDFGNVVYQKSSSITVDLKAANLTGDLTLSLSGTNASYFSLDSYTLSKANAEAGYKLTINCVPDNLGQISAVLNISGGGISSTVVNVKANSTDSFSALAATEIGSDRFTANWSSSANANGYLLDVYSYQVIGTPSKTLLDEGFNSTSLPSGWSATGYYDLSSTGFIRMASGSQNCVLSSPTVDLSSGAILTIVAKQYNSDNGAKIRVDINSDSLTTITTGVDSESFDIVIPESNNSSVLTFTVLKSARVYIDNIKIATSGADETRVSAVGYPKQVGNVLSYQVTGLESDSTYYYNVTPQGNNAASSNQISVKTLAATSVNEIESNREIIVYFGERTLYVSNVNKGEKLTIYDVLGTKILETAVVSDQMGIPFDYKGIFVMKVSDNNKIVGSRKMILH
jgi:endonuclease I